MSRESICVPVFGKLTWDEVRECWRGEVALTPKHLVGVRVFWQDGQPPETEFERWRAVYERVRRSDREIRLAVADLLLAGNDEAAWSRAAKEGQSRENVARQMTLESLELGQYPDTTLWYDNPLISSAYGTSAIVDDEGNVIWAGFW
jgi:hypothetical protein